MCPFNFVESYQVTLSHKFYEMFPQEPSPKSTSFNLQIVPSDKNTGLMEIEFPDVIGKLYFCIKTSRGRMKREVMWEHQGMNEWLSVNVKASAIPLWLNIMIVVILLTLSATLNGLALALMTLDITDLKVLANAGDAKQRKYAQVNKKHSNNRCDSNYGNSAVLLRVISSKSKILI